MFSAGLEKIAKIIRHQMRPSFVPGRVTGNPTLAVPGSRSVNGQPALKAPFSIRTPKPGKMPSQSIQPISGGPGAS